METVPQTAIIGIDVSRDWLDVHCLADGQRQRVPNTSLGHMRLVDLAKPGAALVSFEATGGQEWRLWAALDAAGIETRQLPPAQIKAFAASRGTRAKTDRIDAELIALHGVQARCQAQPPTRKDTCSQNVNIQTQTARGNTQTVDGGDQGAREPRIGRHVRRHGWRIQRFA